MKKIREILNKTIRVSRALDFSSSFCAFLPNSSAKAQLDHIPSSPKLFVIMMMMMTLIMMMVLVMMVVVAAICQTLTIA